MNAPSHKPWTQEEFFAWCEHQEERYEFDGVQPVGMTGGTIGHAIIVRNLQRALDRRLLGGPCQMLGTDAGLATAGGAVRYPDALVTCAALDMTARTVPEATVVFEVLSPTTGRTDRIVKVREYAAVASIRRYVILESRSVGLLVFERASGKDDWRATTLSSGDTLRMPEIGIDVPVADFYDGTGLSS